MIRAGRLQSGAWRIRWAGAAASALLVLSLAAGYAVGPGSGTAATKAPAGPKAVAARPAFSAPVPARAAASCNPDASSLAPASGTSMPPGSFAATIKARGKFIVGVDQSTYHFGFLNPIDNQIEGFDIDIVDAVAQQIFGSGYAGHIEFKAIPDADRVADLRSGTVDMVAHTMTITCDRLRQIDFSSVYYKAHAEMLELKTALTPQHTLKSLADLKGQKVCATTGSDDLALIQRAGAVPVQVTYWTDCLVDLQQGEVAGIVTDDSILHGLADQDPFTAINAQQLEPEPYGLGISRDHPDFVRFVNAVLAHIESDGQWEQDYRQWIGGPAQSPPAPQYAP